MKKFLFVCVLAASIFFGCKDDGKKSGKIAVSKNCEIEYAMDKDGKTLSVAELKKSTGLKDAELNMGLGWLFCEDKLYVKVETVRKKETELIGWK